MKCPFCGFVDTQVIDSRLSTDINAIRRRRKCISCEKRFNTIEQADLRMPMVNKKNNGKEEFDINKLKKSIKIALHKRNKSNDFIDTIVEKIKQNILQLGVKEINSQDIGEYVINELFNIDKVAYVRFASVYKNFEEVSDFKDVIANIPRTKKNN